MEINVNVIGAGLAGSEAAYQLAKRGINVRLYEMRPHKMSPAHKTCGFAELVCSNSLRADGLKNAVGVLKEEMRRLDSLILKAAEEARVPAGGALAVDRDLFSNYITETLRNFENVEIINEEVTNIPEGYTIIASGPLTSDTLSDDIKRLTGENYFYFYDAAAPIVEKDSIDMDKVYLKSRYDKGEAAYLNCPMSESEFFAFYNELINADCVPLKEFEQEIYFQGCMPIEEMARKGEKTMLFGPLKPVGLDDPKTGKRPYAVVQLRQDNASGTLYNLVGFQTHLKWGEQKRVLRMIPGLEQAEFVRYGVMHRNTFINSPNLMKPTYQFKERDDLFFAGQMTGVEGYVESAASGLLSGINMSRLLNNEPLVEFPRETVIGSMAYYITHTEPKHFQPMNANFGLLPELGYKHKKKDRKELYANRALDVLLETKEKYNL
ncbi:FADH(2)-oxidizing methylenetetrahydrofolate--tRNA-(uracil(54)-C(5))-methyltransferase TrmFO [Haloplasma contractile]|uniref:Methylenetetrahydrofolate--tRNA-(uracil-5-)-methyltransferase TrmFO n=1 Tax=Haloplasma contractile SSD-17B TaxID=1033810 RepID=U2FR45_9MOLU|nr:FADH(2)-oxidizing methylenetetrahydrofolate--tRNA-(uracil(54)-C(5))-methyltransferase TrmFO [Haloplasma contractile]ERJ13464.1 methyltransferase TrmFO protein [Haloplasma contractile SSD-17B]